MIDQSHSVSGVAFARQPVPFWLKSQARLKDILLDLACDMLGSADDAANLISALENAHSHPHKAEFIQLAYPVIKAWATTRSALSQARATTCH